MTRREIKPEEKVQAVLELLSGNYLISEVANKYGIVPRTLDYWRKEFLENAHRVFTTTREEKALAQERKDAQAKEASLIQTIGQLTVELDWCKKKSEQAGIMAKKRAY